MPTYKDTEEITKLLLKLGRSYDTDFNKGFFRGMDCAIEIMEDSPVADVAEISKEKLSKIMAIVEKYEKEIIPNYEALIATLTKSLAAYKDTGLTPTEIERIVDAYGRGMTLRTETAKRLAMVSDIKTERIREIASAERESRLAVLPIKPNDAFWHRNYVTGELELNFELHKLEKHDDTYPETKGSAYWE